MSRRDDIVKFVGDALTSGRSRQEIEAALRAAGWGADDIQHGMGAWAESSFVPPVPKPFRRISPKDFFEHALSLGCLVFAAIYLVQLQHELIGMWFDTQDRWWGVRRLRWAIACVVVTAPTYLWLETQHVRRLQRDPARHRSLLRRWVLYIALLAAAGAMIGALIYTIEALLSGDLTAQFALRALSVLVIAGAIFVYHIRADRLETQR